MTDPQPVLLLTGMTVQGCQDCTTLTACFKMLEGFEGVLERPVIGRELHANHLQLLSAYAADLGTVRLSKAVLELSTSTIESLYWLSRVTGSDIRYIILSV